MDALLPVYKWATDNKYPMTAACCQHGSVDGLHSGHAYSLLGVHKIYSSSGALVETLMQMRNPWGTENYYGPWSDKSSKWTAEYKSQVNYVNANDGKFFLPASLFFSTYTDASVAIYDTGLKKSSISDSYAFKNYNGKKYKVVNPTDQAVYITADMLSGRNVPRGSCDPKNSFVLYFKTASGAVAGSVKYGYLGSRGVASVGTFDGNKLPAGTYYLEAVNQNKNKAAKATIHFYSGSEYLKIYYA
jgi:hypothetical protein